MGLEEYSSKKATGAAKEVGEEPTGLSIPEIQQDAKNADLFGYMLRTT